MTEQARHVWDIKQSEDISVRTAAYVLAVQRIAEAVEAHGTRATCHGAQRG
jgi:glutamate dehydrogenase (NADP+)